MLHCRITRFTGQTAGDGIRRAAKENLHVGQLPVFAGRQSLQGERFPGAWNNTALSWIGDGTAAQERGLSTDTATPVDAWFFFSHSGGFGARLTVQQRLDRNHRVNPRKQYAVDLLRNRHLDAEALALLVQGAGAINTLRFLANLF